ncbi:HPr kinase/phosphorylase [Qingshengfaniella alkalisoli]|uniref:Serine kinase n=1 Tax=Qingshengfaniella alkalisoli TaxID=2599296 RepID=A0A5B8J211_9RHOB|nr:serine kinase [Qingshengfaniella alkalisoli]QDY68270.1 serine kinase [Qingshengfaniella alkalisoli]
MTDEIILHASTVVYNGHGLLIEGPSGSGKSSLALSLLALGADLVADDRTKVFLGEAENRPMVVAPRTLPALIEARGVGLLPARLRGPCRLALAVDLGVREQDRLPLSKTRSYLGRDVTLLHNTGRVDFAAALLQYLKSL